MFCGTLATGLVLLRHNTAEHRRLVAHFLSAANTSPTALGALVHAPVSGQKADKILHGGDLPIDYKRFIKTDIRSAKPSIAGSIPAHAANRAVLPFGAFPFQVLRTSPTTPHPSALADRSRTGRKLLHALGVW